jgi:predicted phosphodiesterase
MGYLIEEGRNTPRLCTTLVPEENVYQLNWNGNRVIKFGAIGDTHLCNKWQQLTHLNRMYDIFEKEGIQAVYHAGDLSDGYYKSRPEHVYELFKIGFDEQADYIIENYPRRLGVKTFFVSGNHDDTHIKNGGSNIGIRIAASRPDMKYLGLSNAKVLLTPNCTLEVNHPGDGSQYALSYSLQKMVDSMSGGEKPKILLNGHHHKAFYMPTYRNIHSLEVGCFEAQTPFMKGKKLAAHIGGWICEAHVDDEGTITRFKSEFIPFLVPIRNDY